MNTNIVIIEGKIVGEVRQNAVGDARKVYHFTVGNNRYYLDAKKERQVESNYVDCDFFVSNKFNGDFLKQGAFVSASGRLKQNKWEDKDKNKRSKLIVNVESAHEIKVQGRTEQDSSVKPKEKEEDAPF